MNWRRYSFVQGVWSQMSSGLRCRLVSLAPSRNIGCTSVQYLLRGCPFANSSAGAVAKSAPLSSNDFSIASTPAGSTRSSLSMKMMNSPLAAANPVFRAAPTPAFRTFVITRMRSSRSLYCRAISPLRSGEASSTTIASSSEGISSTESRQADRYSSTPWAGMTTEIKRGGLSSLSAASPISVSFTGVSNQVGISSIEIVAFWTAPRGALRI